MFSERQNDYYKIYELFQNTYIGRNPPDDCDENYFINDYNTDDPYSCRYLDFKMETTIPDKSLYILRKVESYITIDDNHKPKKINSHIYRYTTSFFSYHYDYEESYLFEKYLFGNYFEINVLNPNDKINGVYRHYCSDSYEYSDDEYEYEEEDYDF